MSSEHIAKPLENERPAAGNKRHRRRIHEFPPTFWESCKTGQGNDVTRSGSNTDAEVNAESATEKNSTPETSVPATIIDTPIVVESPTCTLCRVTMQSFLEQRKHFRTDWHRHNVQRSARGRLVLTEDEFEQLSDLGSHSSLSGSEEEQEVDEERLDGTGEPDGYTTPIVPTILTGSSAEQLEFRHPTQENAFLIVYRVSLPDRSTLTSLSHLGSWCVIMAGGGHFCAAIWDTTGKVIAHKTFHRYTTRRKQGGSQAAADEARGNAK